MVIRGPITYEKKTNKPINGTYTPYHERWTSLCRYKDGKRNGVEKVYSVEGVLISETIYDDGQPVGVGKRYFESTGTLKSEITYKNGKKHGLSKIFFRTGDLDTEIPYKEGKRDGIRKTYDVDGSVMKEITYKDGKCISIIGHTKEGKQEDLTIECIFQSNLDTDST